jgi:hypothetical protein
VVATGLSNDEIADRLTVSSHTVKTHVNRTMAKLGAHDRAQLVVIAYETGLVRPGRAKPAGLERASVNRLRAPDDSGLCREIGRAGT